MNQTTVLSVLLAAAPIFAQHIPHEPHSIPREGSSSRTIAGQADWLIPIHADRDDDGAYWASGPTYKVRFGDGMTFYPVLGERAPHNLPLGWETVGAEIEGQMPLMGAEALAARRAQEWRFELVRPGITEVYDVVADGVAQSFVIAHPGLAGITGDLVIRGRIDTPLAAPARAGTHAALRFADGDGRVVLEYGAAFVLDAAQRRLPITSALRDGVIELRVPASWLQTASWPIIVDPLTQRSTLINSASGPSSYPSLAHDFYLDRHLVSDARAVSASDYDLRLYLRNASWGPVATVFSELTTANTRYCTVSYAGSSPRRWLAAFERRTATTGRVRVYFHDASDTGLNTGPTIEIPLPAGVHDSAPSLGTQSGTLAYLAVKRDNAPSPTDTESSYPVGYLIDVASRAFLGSALLHTNPGNNYDVESISVSRLGSALWMVVWQEYNFDNPGDDWDIIGQPVGFSGQLGGHIVLGDGAASGLHKLTPFVDGFDLNWMVAYVTRSNTGLKNVSPQGSSLRVHRFRVDDGVASVIGTPHTVETAPGNDLVLGRTNHPLEMAMGTESHWGLGWRRSHTNELVAARIGFDGRVAEKTVIESAPVSGYYLTPSLCWDYNAMAFAIVYPTDGISVLQPTYGRHFEFDNRAQNTAYGTGCSGTVTAATASLWSSKPFAGTGSYLITLSNARASVPTVLVAGSGPADLPLSGGCRLLLDPSGTFLVVHQSLSGVGGNRTIELAIPSAARFASIFWQFAQFDAGTLTTSNGLHTQIY